MKTKIDWTKVRQTTIKELKHFAKGYAVTAIFAICFLAFGMEFSKLPLVVQNISVGVVCLFAFGVWIYVLISIRKRNLEFERVYGKEIREIQEIATDALNKPTP